MMRIRFSLILLRQVDTSYVRESAVGGSVAERRTQRARGRGYKTFLHRAVPLSNTLLPESTGNTQEAVAPS